MDEAFLNCSKVATVFDKLVPANIVSIISNQLKSSQICITDVNTCHSMMLCILVVIFVLILLLQNHVQGCVQSRDVLLVSVEVNTILPNPFIEMEKSEGKKKRGKKRGRMHLK